MVKSTSPIPFLPEERNTLKATLLIASLTATITLLLLTFYPGESNIIPKIIFALMFLVLIPYEIHRLDPKNPMKRKLAILTVGVLYGMSFVYIEVLLFSLWNQFTDWSMDIVPRIILTIVMIIVAYVYYKVGRAFDLGKDNLNSSTTRGHYNKPSPQDPSHHLQQKLQ